MCVRFRGAGGGSRENSVSTGRAHLYEFQRWTEPSNMYGESFFKNWRDDKPKLQRTSSPRPPRGRRAVTWVGGPPGTWVVRHLPRSASSHPRVRPSPRSHKTQSAPSLHPPPHRPSRPRHTQAGDLPSAAWHGQNGPR